MYAPLSCLSSAFQLCTLTSSQSIPFEGSVPDKGEGTIPPLVGGGGDIHSRKVSAMVSEVIGVSSFGVIDEGKKKWVVGRYGAGLM